MNHTYKYGHRPRKKSRLRPWVIMTVTLLILGAVAGLVALDLRRNRSGPVEGDSRNVTQALDSANSAVTVDEPTFSLQLPGDWKLAGRLSNHVENSVTWQATKAHEDNRTLKIYVDVIPKNYAVNRLLPLTTRGASLTVGEVSGNCAGFTKHSGPREDVVEPAKWQGIDFLCDLARTIDNQIGTGSTEGINTITVTGPTKGKHNYFFLYTDRNIQPNYNIFYDALRSFKAK